MNAELLRCKAAARCGDTQHGARTKTTRQPTSFAARKACNPSSKIDPTLATRSDGIPAPSPSVTNLAYVTRVGTRVALQTAALRRTVASARFPCSIHETPASSARLIESVVYAWAQTYVPTAWASWTKAAISSCENCVEVSLSVGDAATAQAQPLSTSRWMLIQLLTHPLRRWP